MKTEFNYVYRGKLHKKYLTVSEVAELIRTGKYAKGVETLRKEIVKCQSLNVNLDIAALNNLPYVVFPKGESGYTGYVMVSLLCKDEDRIAELRTAINRYHQVVCSFRGASDMTFKVVMAYSLSDDRSLDLLDSSELTLFHTNAYCRAVDFIHANTGLRGDGKGCNNEDGCRISYDKEVFVNQNVVPIIMDMPSSLPDSQFVAEISNGESVRCDDKLPGYSDVEMEVTRFNLVRRTLDVNPQGDDATEVIALAEACCKCGVNEEIAVKCTLAMSRFRDKQFMVRTAFERAYEDGNTQKNNSLLPKNVLNIELMQHFLSSRYRFRQNEMTGSVEYAELNRYVSTWKPFTDRERNTVCLEALKAGIEVWDKDIKRYVNSTYVNTYDPISDWIFNLPQWDGRDRVGELAANVKTDWDRWPEMFRIWLRSMVAQWSGINHTYGATMVLMLTGKQGTGKSTFFKRLIPTELSAYYVDRLDFTNKKEAERALIRFCLINLDEFDQISPRQTAFLKHMLQKSDIMYRKMYQDDIEQRRRYATFCATTNSDAPLSDPTGSRRYLVVEVTDTINNAYDIDYEQLYAQVEYEIRHNQTAYFTTEMECEVQIHNGNYTEELPLATMFDHTFSITSKAEECEELSSTEILLALKAKYKTGITVNRSTSTQLGKYLGSQGVHSVLKDGKRVYNLTRL